MWRLEPLNNDTKLPIFPSPPAGVIVHRGSSAVRPRRFNSAENQVR